MVVKKGTQIFILFTLLVLAPRINGHLYVLLGNLLTPLINAISFIFPLYSEHHVGGSSDQYDFIIIGSSPSGSVVANRLTENPSTTVLLLEAGEEASFVTEVPLFAGALGSTKYDYKYRTQPQPGFCRGCIENSIAWEHGKALGGTTIINYMLYVRGNKRDYDIWANLGNPGWSYQDLLPYFIKVEDSHVARSDIKYRGRGGYLTVNDVGYRTEISKSYIKGCQEAGYKYVDYNGAQQMGVSYVQVTTRNGQRCSAEKAYLRLVRLRSNLEIKTKARVTKILIDPNTKTANGVEYFHGNSFHHAYTRKEVILSAGALNSPQVLMLSGIGPSSQLETLGIPVIKSLPVGQKMYDHATFPVTVFQLNESIVINPIKEVLNPLNYIEFPTGKGFFTSPGGVEAITYIKTKMSIDPDPMYPDIELLMLGGALSTDHGIIFRKMFNIPPLIYDKVFKPLEENYVYQVTPILLHPKSYGSVRLNSSNPFDSPIFYANYFSDPENHDIKTFIAGIRELQRINLSPALQRYKSTIVSIPVPGCEGLIFNSDDYWECALRTVIGSYYHQVGTCKMGPKNDSEAVVDNELRVHGIKNIRVVDTSVIPITPSAHIAAPAYVIGEKAADLIKKFWNI